MCVCLGALVGSGFCISKHFFGSCGRLAQLSQIGFSNRTEHDVRRLVRLILLMSV